MKLKKYKGSKFLRYIGNIYDTHYIIGKINGRNDGLHILHKVFRINCNKWDTIHDKTRGFTFEHKLIIKGSEEDCMIALENELMGLNKKD